MEEKRKAGRPKGSKTVNKETAKETNATFVVDKIQLAKIKELARILSFKKTIESGQIETVKLKDIVKEAFDNYLKLHKK